MLYLEDYLELIEHLPLELRDRFTDIRENDLQVQNSKEQLREKVKAFFAEAQKLEPEKRQCEYQHLLSCYEQTMRYAEEKVKIADQMQEIMLKLVQRLDGELEKFKLELEADHAGITEELEKRSLELDLVSQAEPSNNNSLALSSSAVSKTTASGLKDRRRSEHKHRHHPYQNNQDNGYHVRAKSSTSVHNPSKNSSIRNSYNHHLQQSRHGSKSGQNICNMIQQHVAEPLSQSKSCSLSANDDGHLDFVSRKESEMKRNYGNNLSSYTNNQSVKSLNKNSSIHGIDANGTPYINRHSALGAPLSSTTTTSTNSPRMNSVSSAIHYGTKANGPNSNGKHSNPLCISAKKSNKLNKRARRDDSHMYPDESSTSLSSDNSAFENSESVSSADYIETGTTFGSTSPSSLDFSSNGQVNSTLYHIDEKKYCICRQVSYGEMVGCDNEECELEWFHYDCVGITLPPKGKWYCPDCRRKMAGHQQQHQHHLSTQNQKESISLVRLS